MRRIIFWLIAVCLMISAVGCVTNNIPEDIMDQDRMKFLLKEFHLANALAQRVGKSLEEKEANRQEFFSAILEREGETRENFLKSYLFYLENPKYLDAIYKQIVEEFNEEVSIEEDFRYNIMRAKKDDFVSKLKSGTPDSLIKDTNSIKPAQKPNSQK